jgi:hypothetical protein
MPMKNKVFVAMLLVCALTSATVYGAWAQAESMLGVKAGDNFTYSFEVFWSSTDPNKLVPQEFSDMNQTLSIHFNVTDVGSTIAYVNITILTRDGNHVDEPGFIEVMSGRWVGAPLFIIGANLTVGDKAYNQSDPAAVSAGVAAESFTITETVTLTYLGTSREVNHYYNSTTDANGTVITDAYYDRATGVLLEMTTSQSLAVNVDETYSKHWKITQFNSAETTPPNGGGTGGTNSFDWSSLIVPAVIVAVFVVVVVVALLVMRRRKKPEVQEPEPLPAEPQPPV